MAPRSISADDVALALVEARVRAGALAVFHVSPISSALLQECVLTALATGMDVRATLHIENLAAEQLSVDIKAAVTFNYVLLTVAVPPGTPDGSLVIINNVWVAGRAVVLNELLSCVTIGFNHVPVIIDGYRSVYAAAAAADKPGLIVAIHKGKSTEQTDTVSTGGVCALNNMSVVILHSLYYRMAALPVLC